MTVYAVARPEDEGKVVTLECDECDAVLRLLLPLRMEVVSGAMEDFSARHAAHEEDADG